MKKRIYIVLIILLIVIGSTFAYYASNYSGVVTTKSKTFGFNVYKIIKTSENIFSDIDLYDTALVHNNVSDNKYIVPGDYGEFIIKVDSTGSEVKLKYDIVLTGENLPTNMKFYLDNEKLDKVELNPLTISGILNLNEEKEHTIYWEWPYDSGENNNLDYEFQGKTFNISVDITGRQGMETEYAINYIGFDNSTQYPSVINKDDEIIIDMSKYNYTSLNLKQGENDLSLDTHYTYENGILKLHNIIDDVTITNLTSFCTRYKEITNLGECLIATDYSNFRKDKSLENAKKNIESKIVDFTKTEPYLNYSEKINLNIINDNLKASNAEYYYYTTSKPTFNVMTGYHELIDAKIGTIEEIKNNNGYTCLYTWGESLCNSVYKINSYKEENGKILLTDYDKYTYKVNNDYSSKAGLYAIDDEDTNKTGEKSYYYRGEVNNNWVSFGGNYYRIIRINGDGSIRLIYSGTKENHTGTETMIDFSAFNTNIQEPTYLGYMYNDDFKIAEEPNTEPIKVSDYIQYAYIYQQKYYFTNERPTCDVNTKTCSFTCRLNENCKYVTWEELNNNYDKNDSLSTSNVWKYTSDYKYTCFNDANIKSNADGSKNISCQISFEIMGVEGESEYLKKKSARVKYYGLISTNYESSTENKKDSVIKTVVDKWYKENIYDKNLESYIVNQVFCNDRSIKSGDGYGFKSTRYNTNYRIMTLYNPSLICVNNNDKFTLKGNSLSGIKGSLNYGNNALDYPVGLITVDEVMLAGGLYYVMNSKYYLYNNNFIWTSSPFIFYGSYSALNAHASFITSSGEINAGTLLSSAGVRPVINLKSDVTMIGGSGTETDPYVLF